jgi:hypothetical protein
LCIISFVSAGYDSSKANVAHRRSSPIVVIKVMVVESTALGSTAGFNANISIAQSGKLL